MAFNLQYFTFSASLLILLTACGGGKSSGGDNSGNSGDGTIKGKTIASIVEASGICYSSEKDALFVVSDKGVVYKLNMQGEILEQQELRTRKKNKKYDMEGVACDDNGRIVIAIEGKDNLLTVSQDDLKDVLRDGEGNPMGDITRPDDTLLKDPKDKAKVTGIEGVAINNGIAYVSNQSSVAYPGEDSSFVFTVDDYTAAAPEVDTVIDHGKKEIVGLSFYQGDLIMISSLDHTLIRYDLEKEEIVSTKALPSGLDAEGVTFDNEGNIYFADDKNGKVYQYKAADFDIK